MSKKYADLDRLNAIELVKNGMSITDAAKILNIPRTTVSTWCRAYKHEDKYVPPKVTLPNKEIDQLNARVSELENRLELEQLRVRVDQLEKQIQELRQSIDPKLQWVDRKMRTEQKQRDQESQPEPKLRWQPGLKK